MTSAFIVNRLRAKPVEYSVNISHFVRDGEWTMGVSIKDLAEPDKEQRERVASDLRAAADLIEREDQWIKQ